MTKKEPKEKLDRTTKHVLINMIKSRILPLVEKENKRLHTINKERRQQYEAAIAEWNKAAEPAKMAEFLKRPRIFTEMNGLGGPKINERALDDWYASKHPLPVCTVIEAETEQVHFAALFDERSHYDREVVVNVPSAFAEPVRELANAIDMAFLSGTAVGLIEAINAAAKSLGE